MISLTAVILTFNEERNIERCLEGLRWVPEVIIIDSFSNDRSRDIAATFDNTRVMQRVFDTHATQWNFALAQVKTPWALTLDADYILPSKLAEEIAHLEPDETTTGYIASFNYIVFGRPLRLSLYPPRTVLFRRDAASYYDEGHTQKLKTTGIERCLRNRIDHDDRKPLSHWIRSQDRYAAIEAKYLLSMEISELSFQDKIRRKIYLAPVLMPIYLLLRRRLLFDGWRGWFYVCQRTLAEFLLSLRLLVERKGLH